VDQQSGFLMRNSYHALQRFEVAGSHGEGFSAAKGLVRNQTELAGARANGSPAIASNRFIIVKSRVGVSPGVQFTL
jgi:hypothetical protein